MLTWELRLASNRPRTAENKKASANHMKISLELIITRHGQRKLSRGFKQLTSGLESDDKEDEKKTTRTQENIISPSRCWCSFLSLAVWTFFYFFPLPPPRWQNCRAFTTKLAFPFWHLPVVVVVDQIANGGFSYLLHKFWVAKERSGMKRNKKLSLFLDTCFCWGWLFVWISLHLVYTTPTLAGLGLRSSQVLE